MKNRKVYIGLGSNMGDKKLNLRRAIEEIEARGVARVVDRSSLYETAPVGFEKQDDFINAAALIETGLDLRSLLDALLDIEKSMGRVRTEKNGPRIIDLDILLCGNEVLSEKGLEVPHPRLAERGFVLKPLAEIGPEAVIPVSGLTVKQMLSRLEDFSRVERLNEKL